MSERIIQLEERPVTGQEIYVKSMELSAQKKVDEILPWIIPGTILDLCAGAGPITDILSLKLPGSRLVAVDFSDDMVARMESRFRERSNVEVLKGNVTEFSYPKEFNTALFISGLHEVFSFGGYDHWVVIKTLENLIKNPRFLKGGRLIIRDGVQPEPEQLYLFPKTDFAADRFVRFIDGFSGVRHVNYMIGRFQDDVFIQSGRRNFTKSDIGSSLIEISSQNASEMLSKYHYSEENLSTELKEQFGIWTLREYQKVLVTLGYTVKYADTFVLPYLKDNIYSRDWEIYHLKNGMLQKTEYPPSTMLLVAEKT